jgi:phage recombination protein Bet
MSENTNIEKSRNAIAIWENLGEVRAQFAPTLSDKEFAFFVTLGKSLGANPFKREIWAVKYDASKPASIFLGRDFYRMKAQDQEDYDGHLADAVYKNDNFKVVNGIPEHSYSMLDRGPLIGAYCVVYRKSIKNPYFVFVKIDEYNKAFALWKSMPHTMIVKVAEAQGLRGAFQGIFAGTYDESEQWTVQPSAKGQIPPPPIKSKFDEIVTVTASEEPEPPKGNPATESEPPTGAGAELDIFAELDAKIDAYCKGDKANKTEVYKTLTAFTGSDKVVRSAWSIEQLKGWKSSEKIAKATMHKFDERVQMGTKFRFEV